MSLINQMLKDLARRTKPMPNSDAIVSGLAITTYRHVTLNKSFLWLIPSSLYLILIIALLIFPVHHQPQSAATKTLTSNLLNTHFKPILSVINSAPMGSVKLTGITLQVQKDQTNLRLMLSQNTHYRVGSDGKNRLMITLENTQLIANLPQIDTLNSAIKIIRMTNQADGSLKIVLLLHAGGELSHLEINEAGKLPELQIDLSYKNVGEPALHNFTQGDIVEEQQLNTMKKVSRDTAMNTEYQRLINYLTPDQASETIVLLTRFLAKYPEFIPARKALVTELLKQGNIAKAEQIIDRGLQLQPLYPPYIQLKAQILVEKGNVNDALTLLHAASPSLEENPEYYALIAALYQRQNKSMLAEKLYESLLNQQPTNSIWWMGLGIAREALNKKSEAVEAYAKAESTENLSPELKVYVENRIHALL